MSKPIVGVLALQGDFVEHVEILHSLNIPTQEVRNISDANMTAGLIIPGGESTAIGKLLKSTKLDKWIKNNATNGYPVFGTCAGCILIAQDVDSEYSLKLIDITVSRNAYGRQLDSFETILTGTKLKNVHGIFIRAPKITKVSSTVNILLKYKKEPVLVQQDNILAGTFHPELSTNAVVHEYFAKLVKKFNYHE
ncbi:MAG: pyridoxal 5'-phosphate synthase glutaminase subunit PdxT [bacterium]|nr:pyridoxal 5'-phosphate synthase glutaminase subunit PdxT [bacterium]